MRRSLGFQQQCYGNGNGKGYGHGHGYGGMWAKSQDQMQHYEGHEESWESHNSGMNMRRGGGGWHGQVDYSEYSDKHHATFGGKGSHGQLQQAWHGGNGGKKWRNPNIQHGHGHGGNFNSHFNSNSNGHFGYVSEDEFEFESYSNDTHGFPEATARVNVNEMRYEHHNLGKNMNWNPKAGAHKAEWLIKGV